MKITFRVLLFGLMFMSAGFAQDKSVPARGAANFTIRFDERREMRDKPQLQVIHPNRSVCSSSGRGPGPGTDWRCIHPPGTCISIQSAITNGKFKSDEELTGFLKTFTIDAPQYGQHKRTGFRLATKEEANIYTALYQAMTMPDKIYPGKGYTFVFIVGFDQPTNPVPLATPAASSPSAK